MSELKLVNKKKPTTIKVIDFIKFVTKYSVMQKNEKGTWELRHTSWNEDNAWREADKLAGQVKVVYPDGLSIPKEDNRR